MDKKTFYEIGAITALGALFYWWHKSELKSVATSMPIDKTVVTTLPNGMSATPEWTAFIANGGMPLLGQWYFGGANNGLTSELDALKSLNKNGAPEQYTPLFGLVGYSASTLVGG